MAAAYDMPFGSVLQLYCENRRRDRIKTCLLYTSELREDEDYEEVEQVAYIQSHFGFFIRFGDLFDLAYNGTIGDPYRGHGLGVQHILCLLYTSARVLPVKIYAVKAALCHQFAAGLRQVAAKLFGCAHYGKSVRFFRYNG